MSATIKKENPLDWLNRIIAEQSTQHASTYGSPTALSEAAKATEFFTEDELEEACKLHRNTTNNS